MFALLAAQREILWVVLSAWALERVSQRLLQKAISQHADRAIARQDTNTRVWEELGRLLRLRVSYFRNPRVVLMRFGVRRDVHVTPLRATSGNAQPGRCRNSSNLITCGWR